MDNYKYTFKKRWEVTLQSVKYLFRETKLYVFADTIEFSLLDIFNSVTLNSDIIPYPIQNSINSQHFLTSVGRVFLLV